MPPCPADAGRAPPMPPCPVEAPSAYKDIRAVARAQRELVKIMRVLRPVLNYKGI
jgi:RNA-splicing ligase RtcB